MLITKTNGAVVVLELPMGMLNTIVEFGCAFVYVITAPSDPGDPSFLVLVTTFEPAIVADAETAEVPLVGSVTVAMIPCTPGLLKLGVIVTVIVVNIFGSALNVTDVFTLASAGLT